ncbi:MAG TPA: DUF4388 domain-containing protein [Ktedonobacterales bacterium]
MTMQGYLSGAVSEFPLVELVQTMGVGGSTGALHLMRSDGASGVVYFENGDVVSAVEVGANGLALGDVLQQLDYASKPQLEHAFEQQRRDVLGKRIGERLVDMALLSEAQLQTALRTQIMWTVREMAVWRDGSYQFRPGERLPMDTITVRVGYEDIALEIIRYEGEWETLRSFLPDGMRTHVAMVYEPPFDLQLMFHPAVWRAISKVNKHHSVRRIATALHQNELDVARQLAGLRRDGLLTVVTPGLAAPLSEPASRINVEGLDLFTLIIAFEQDWLKRRSFSDHLVGLATYVNRTMEELEKLLARNDLTLAPDSLANILREHRLSMIGDYHLKVERNRINTEHLGAHSRRLLEGSNRRTALDATTDYYGEALFILQQALRAAFDAINRRVGSPDLRRANQEAWEALFLTMEQTLNDG